MSREELIEFLKDNLVVRLDQGRYGDSLLYVELWIGEEKISEDSIYVEMSTDSRF